MNDELSKALDGAISDAAEMGSINVSQPWSRSDYWVCDLYLDGGRIIACVFGQTTSEAERRARLIVESVNGRVAMAKRIAELEAALEKISCEGENCIMDEQGRHLRTCRMIAEAALTRKAVRDERQGLG